jgi:hypothetical protein
MPLSKGKLHRYENLLDHQRNSLHASALGQFRCLFKMFSKYSLIFRPVSCDAVNKAASVNTITQNLAILSRINQNSPP